MLGQASYSTRGDLQLTRPKASPSAALPEALQQAIAVSGKDFSQSLWRWGRLGGGGVELSRNQPAKGRAVAAALSMAASISGQKAVSRATRRIIPARSQHFTQRRSRNFAKC